MLNFKNKEFIAKLLLVLAILAVIVGLTAWKNRNSQEQEQEPQQYLTAEEVQARTDFDTAVFHTADSGEMIVPSVVPLSSPTAVIGSTPDTVWDQDTGYTRYFNTTDTLTVSNGSLGTLAIPRIGLTVSVYEAEDEIEAMAHGVAHMPITSAWAGNVGICGHNSGVNTFFANLYQLQAGDEIIYTTSEGSRNYKVETSKTVDEYDWSMLSRTEDNRITLITCITGQPTNRLCVQAVEV